MPWTRRGSYTPNQTFRGKHRREHWYRDNQVCSLTARCRDRFPAFAKDDAKAVFWDRFDRYTGLHGFAPGASSLLDNHYHSIGYLRVGEELGPMMRKLRGSVAKLVDDLLPEPRVPFWGDRKHLDCFDGCLRDERQGRLTYRDVLTQAVRHGIVDDWRRYPHTHLQVELERVIGRANELGARLYGVPCPRYQR